MNIIQLDIDKNNYKEIKNIKKKKQKKLCKKIFDYGYKCFYPNNVYNQENNDYNIIRNDLIKLDNKIDNINITDNINKIHNSIDKICGISENSFKKGKLTEKIIYEKIKKTDKNLIIEKTNDQPHQGDIIISKKINNKKISILVEIKNYSSIVNKTEIEKMKYDMKQNNINYGIIYSMRSGFYNKVQKFTMEKCDELNILYVPNINDNLEKIECSIECMEKIIELRTNENKKNEENVNNYIKNYINLIKTKFEEFDQLIENNRKIKKEINKLFKNNEKQLLNYKNDLHDKIQELDENFIKLKNDNNSEKKTRIINMIKKNKKYDIYCKDNKYYILDKNKKKIGLIKNKKIKILNTSIEIKIKTEKDIDLINNFSN